ncbi:MAG: response regulator transcription factor, partial [Novibacillus thermophilus]
YPTAAKQLVEDFLQHGDEEKVPDVYRVLSEREREILTLIAKGYSNKEIAELLVISVKTVESHKAHIMEKLGLSTRPQLVHYAIKKGLLDLDFEDHLVSPEI